MLALLRRAARFVRLTLVCLALVWSSAPAAVAPITDAVALIAVGREATTDRTPTEPAEHVARAPEPAARVSAAAPFAAQIRRTRAPSPPRRLYLEHRALLC